MRIFLIKIVSFAQEGGIHYSIVALKGYIHNPTKQTEGGFLDDEQFEILFYLAYCSFDRIAACG